MVGNHSMCGETTHLHYIGNHFIDNLNYDFSYRTARKKSPKNSKERNGKRKETFPPAPLYKEKEKEKAEKRRRKEKEKSTLEKTRLFYLYQTPEAFGLSTKSVWAKHPKRLGETPEAFGRNTRGIFPHVQYFGD